jgi:hypothetical protein
MDTLARFAVVRAFLGLYSCAAAPLVGGTVFYPLRCAGGYGLGEFREEGSFGYPLDFDGGAGWEAFLASGYFCLEPDCYAVFGLADLG